MPVPRWSSIRRFFPAAALVLSAQTAAAGIDSWTPLGPDGGTVFALALDPHTGSLYAGTRAGVWKSTDDGASWDAAGGELPGIDGPAGGALVQALAADPDRADALYAGVSGHGAFKSLDGGETWQEANTGLVGHTSILIPHPRVPGTVYAATTAGIFRTTNGGGRWTQLPRFPTTVTSIDPTALAVDPAATQTLYAGVNDGLLKTANGGATWSHVGASSFGGRRIDALAVHPTAAGTVYAAAANIFEGSTALWRSPDGGATWTNVSQGLPAKGRITALAVLPAAPHVIYAGVFGAGVFKSVDGGGQWARVNAALTNVAALVPDLGASGRLYAAAEGLETAGVFRTSDGGGSWVPSSRGISGFWVEALVIDPRTPSTLYVGSTRGVLKSTDGGQSWTPVNQGLGRPGDSLYVRSLAIDPKDPRVLYAGLSQDLFKTVDGGLHWQQTANPRVAEVDLLDVDPQQPSVLHAANHYEGFSRSTDGGATWSHVAGEAASDLASLGVTDIARDPSSPAVLYATTVYTGWPEGYVEPGLFKSTDRGATWTRIADGYFGALAFDPKTPSTLYATGEGRAILKSTDGGAHWIKVGTAPVIASVLLVDPIVSTTLYVADYASAGIFRSDDGGATWTAWNDGLRQLAVSSLAFDPAMPGKLYVATRGGGVSTRLGSVPAPCAPGPTALCLQGGRFRVEVAWQDFAGNTGVGRTLPLTDDTGAFWFFDDENLELTVKVLDGRGLNDRFWVFYGSLTTVGFALTVTDTATLRQRTYRNPSGTFASAGDTDAF